MKTIRRWGLIAGILLLTGMANAQQVVTIQDVMDYTDDLWDEDAGVWFIPPDEILDHSPWHRGSNQDWGWTHNLAGLVPIDATGIQSATVTIMGWDVDSDEGEDDVILVNSRYMGMLAGVDRDWQAVTFNLTSDMIADLWQNKTLHIYMDIDQMLDFSIGYRVTLKSSTLAVTYTVSGSATPTTIPVYRFWSPVFSGHFYTTSEAERDGLIANYPDVWTYEETAFRALPDAGGTTARPVHRFWSGMHNAHFYTLDDAEKQWLIDNYSSIWTYEGVAFYGFAPGEQPSGTMPVHRFWSPIYSHHFYTLNEAEKQWLVDNYSYAWTYEGVVWHAYTR